MSRIGGYRNQEIPSVGSGLSPARSPIPPTATPAIASASPAPPSSGSESGGPQMSAFQRTMTAIGRELDRGEALNQRVTEGKFPTSDPGQLIALQAGVYRYSEVVDLTAKLVDRASNALRTVLQGSGH